MKDNIIDRQREKILNGSLWKAIFLITIPIALYNLVQNIFELIDIYFSGYIGENQFSFHYLVNSYKAIPTAIDKFKESIVL